VRGGIKRNSILQLLPHASREERPEFERFPIFATVKGSWGPIVVAKIGFSR
jgi:hypothetical protein